MLTIDLSEVHALADAERRAADRVYDDTSKAVSKFAHDTETTAEVLVPVDTAFLKGTVTSDIDGLSAIVGPTAEYGDYVERGTENEDGSQRTPPQPYMGPAFDTHLPRFEAALGVIGTTVLR